MMMMMMVMKGSDIRWAWRWEPLGRSETLCSVLSWAEGLFNQSSILSRIHVVLPRNYVVPLIQLCHCSCTFLRWYSFPNANTALHRSFEWLRCESKALLPQVQPPLPFLQAIVAIFPSFQVSILTQKKKDQLNR
jgi:hypothetical protein